MTNVNDLAEQHMLAYESRQRHTGELLERARQRIGTGPEHAGAQREVEQLAQQHAELSAALQKMKEEPQQDWQQGEIEQAGPMAVWDVLAQQLEKLVERLR